MILLDTDHCISVIRGSEKVRAKLNEHLQLEPAISVITVGELYFGAMRSQRPTSNTKSCKAFIATVNVLPLTTDIMIQFAEEKARLAADGNLIEDLDLLIASTAIFHDLELATHNTSHFSRFMNLRLVDWIA